MLEAKHRANLYLKKTKFPPSKYFINIGGARAIIIRSFRWHAYLHFTTLEGPWRTIIS